MYFDIILTFLYFKDDILHGIKLNLRFFLRVKVSVIYLYDNIFFFNIL